MLIKTAKHNKNDFLLLDELHCNNSEQGVVEQLNEMHNNLHIMFRHGNME